jgi:hypothetical protein
MIFINFAFSFFYAFFAQSTFLLFNSTAAIRQPALVPLASLCAAKSFLSQIIGYSTPLDMSDGVVVVVPFSIYSFSHSSLTIMLIILSQFEIQTKCQVTFRKRRTVQGHAIAQGEPCICDNLTFRKSRLFFAHSSSTIPPGWFLYY